MGKEDGMNTLYLAFRGDNPRVSRVSRQQNLNFLTPLKENARRKEKKSHRADHPLKGARGGDAMWMGGHTFLWILACLAAGCLRTCENSPALSRAASALAPEGRGPDPLLFVRVPNLLSWGPRTFPAAGHGRLPVGLAQLRGMGELVGGNRSERREPSPAGKKRKEFKSQPYRPPSSPSSSSHTSTIRNRSWEEALSSAEVLGEGGRGPRIRRLDMPAARPKHYEEEPSEVDRRMRVSRATPPPNGQPFGQVGKWQKIKRKNTDAVKMIKCGVCVVPPKELWDQIQSVRSENDRHFGKWMPHINLRYPIMLTERQLEAMPGILQEALSKSKPFSVSLDSFGTFEHPVSSMLWARPSVGEYELRQLHYILSQLFPRHFTGSGEEYVEEANREFTPHLCLGQWKDQDEMFRVRDEVSGHWKSLEWEVNQLYVVTSTSEQQMEKLSGNETLGIRCTVQLTGNDDWTPFSCPLSPPASASAPSILSTRKPRFQSYADPIPESPPLLPADHSERHRLALLAASLHEVRRGEHHPLGGIGHARNVTEGSTHAVARGGDAARAGGVQDVAVVPGLRFMAPGSTDDLYMQAGDSGSSDSEDEWDGPTYEENFMPRVGDQFAKPQVLRAPAIKDKWTQTRVFTFADLPAATYKKPGKAQVDAPARPPLEQLILEHAQTSLHGMKSRLQPLAAKILVSGTADEKEQLRVVVDKRKAIVQRREQQLQEKQVFNRKVASAISAPKGQVSLLQVREHTWQTLIVEARREFSVNKLKLEAFESEEAQARRWAIAMGRDVVQHFTMLDKQGVKALVRDADKWARVKDVLQAQACLKLEQSIVSLLETCDLDASDDLAFDYIMAVTDFGFGQRTQWDEHVNSRRQSAKFRMDVNNVPGWYVYYDMYGWC